MGKKTISLANRFCFLPFSAIGAMNENSQEPINNASPIEPSAQSDSTDAPQAAEPVASEEIPSPRIPTAERVTNYLLFGLSLPERALRSTSAALSGAVRESAALLVPQAFRSSKTYSIFVEQMLDFLAHDVGRVERNPKDGEDEGEVENYVAKKTVGGFIELAALPLLHVSPMTVLAIISDVAYGSQTYLNELSTELKAQGVIDQDSTIDRASDLLDALKKTSTVATDALDQPPLSIDGLAETIQQVTEASQGSELTKAIPRGEIERLWNEMHVIAAKENQSVLQISSAMSMFAMNRIGQLGQGALSTISVAGNMFDRHIIDHYRDGLTELGEQGFYNFLANTSKPYISAMWSNFSSENETITEDLLSGRMLGRTWQAVNRWFK